MATKKQKSVAVDQVKVHKAKPAVAPVVVAPVDPALDRKGLDRAPTGTELSSRETEFRKDAVVYRRSINGELVLLRPADAKALCRAKGDAKWFIAEPDIDPATLEVPTGKLLYNATERRALWLEGLRRDRELFDLLQAKRAEESKVKREAEAGEGTKTQVKFNHKGGKARETFGNDHAPTAVIRAIGLRYGEGKEVIAAVRATMAALGLTLSDSTVSIQVRRGHRKLEGAPAELTDAEWKTLSDAGLSVLEVVYKPEAKPAAKASKKASSSKAKQA